MEFGYWERDSIGGLEWTQDAITFSADGEEFGTLENNGGLPFNKDFFMILNVAMGGNFGGEINPAFTGSSMEVDYIRVYQ
jgi:beta-glucanase (GH16 family)